MNNVACVGDCGEQGVAGVRNGSGCSRDRQPFPTRRGDRLQLLLYRDEFLEQRTEPRRRNWGADLLPRSNCHGSSPIISDANDSTPATDTSYDKPLAKVRPCGSEHTAVRRYVNHRTDNKSTQSVG